MRLPAGRLSSIDTSEAVADGEASGRGKPRIPLHGWLESGSPCRETVEGFACKHRSRALDSWGLGESDAAPDSRTMQDFAALVDNAMERMGIQQAPIIGHSMGGSAGLGRALEKPWRVQGLVMMGSCSVGGTLNSLPRLAGRHTIALLVRHGLGLSSRRMLRDGRQRWYQVIIDDLLQTPSESLLHSTSSPARTDSRCCVENQRVSTLGAFRQNDSAVNSSEARTVSQRASAAQADIADDSKHFPMPGEPESFNVLLMDFISNGESNALLRR